MKKVENNNFDNTIKKMENEDLLNKLLFTGKTSKKVVIADLEFELQTLTEKDSRDVFAVLLSFSDEKRLPIIKGVTLAKSISSINGVNFSQFAKELLEKEGSKVDDLAIANKKNEVVLMMQTSITSKLFEEYEELSREAKDSISVEKIKN